MADKKLNPIQSIIEAQVKLCENDPIYFMKKFVNIQADDGRILFALFDFQEKLVKHFNNPNEKRISIVKSRQMGITTVCAAYALWLILFHSDRKVVSLAPTQEKAKLILDKIIFAYDNLPSWLKKDGRDYTEKQKLSLTLSNGSGVKAASGDSNAARGFTAHFLIVDEAAIIDRAEELWASAQQTLITTNGSAVVLSTPNGVSNWFYKNHNKAVQNSQNKDKKPDDFIALRLPWNLNKRRNQAWRDQQTQELGERLAAQECDCNFQTSGATVIPPKIIEWYEKESGYIKAPKSTYGVYNDFWVWKDPVPGRTYVGVSDIGRGDDTGDFSTLHIFDLEDNEQVAEYRGRMDTKEFAKFLVGQGYLYNQMLIVIERESIGWAVVKDVLETAYPNLYYSPKEGMVMDAETYLQRNYDNNTANMVPGFSTNVRFRPLVINCFRTAIENKRIIIHSIRTIDEWRTFIYNDVNKATAAKGFNDDLTIPIGIYEFLRDTAFRFSENAVALSKQTIASFRIGSISRKSSDVPAVLSSADAPRTQHINNNQRGIRSGDPFPVINTKNLKVNPFKIRVPGRNREEDTSWLL